MDFLTISRIIIPALCVILVQWVIAPAIYKKTLAQNKLADDGRYVCYSREVVICFAVLTALALILTLVALVATIVYVVAPEVAETSDEDVYYMVIAWAAALGLDVLMTALMYIFTKKVSYDDETVTIRGLFRFTRSYAYSEITAVRDTVSDGTTSSGETKLFKKFVVYFGKRKISLHSVMMGVIAFRDAVSAKRPDLDIRIRQDGINEN